MSFLDTLNNLNPFKKKDEFSFSSLDQQNHDLGHPNFQQGNNMDFAQPNLDSSPDFNSGSFSANPPNSQMPMDDHRMTMPLGESVRQTRISAMYGNDQSPHEIHETRDHNPLQKDLELISSKLDYLKASLDAINQRLVNLEHLARQDNENNNRRW